jgi:general secretion pathway protein J
VRLNGNDPRKEFIYTRSGSFSSSSDNIGFVRQGWRNPQLILPRGDLQSLAYLLEESNLYRLHFNFVDPVVGEEPKRRLLIEGINELRFEFYDGKRWQEQPADGQIPLAIAVEMDIENFGLVRRQYLTPGKGNTKETDK